MESLTPFNPRDLFKDKNRLILKGGFDPWTLGGKTKLQAGGKIDVPVSVFDIEIPLVAIFDISRVDTVKAADLTEELCAGNIPKPGVHMKFGSIDAASGSDVLIVHLDPETLRFSNLPMPVTRRKEDGSIGPCMI